jgi:hypothetical protein
MTILGWLKREPAAQADSGTFRPPRLTDTLRPSEYRGEGARYLSELLAHTDTDERRIEAEVGSTASYAEPVAGGQERGLSEHRRDEGGMQVTATGHHQAAIVSELRRAETAELMARLWRGYERAANQARETCGTADFVPRARMTEELGSLWVDESLAAAAAGMRQPGTAPQMPARAARAADLDREAGQ